MHIRTLIRTEPGGPNVELKTWQHISGALAVSLVSEFKPRGDGALDGERELVPLPDREITMAGGRHLGMYRITTPGQANGPALTVGLYVEGAGPYVLWERNPEEIRRALPAGTAGHPGEDLPARTPDRHELNLRALPGRPGRAFSVAAICAQSWDDLASFLCRDWDHPARFPLVPWDDLALFHPAE